MQGFRPRVVRFAVAALLVMCGGCDAAAPVRTVRIMTGSGPADIPYVTPRPLKTDPLAPEYAGRIDRSLVPECSGFAASRKFPGVFWTLSDSGDSNRLVAIRADGSTVTSPGGAYAGVRIPGAENRDWEALCPDGRGGLIIGDFGNNNSSRKNLRLFLVPAEPDPTRVRESAAARTVRFHYPDQTGFPDPRRNHDAEALFVRGGAAYVFTKHWTDHDSDLYRIDLSGDGSVSKPAAPVARLDAGGMVTDAAVSPSGRRLAVLTYSGLWVFALPDDPAAHPLSGRAFHRPLAMPPEAWQIEAVAFEDEDTMLIGCEAGELFRVRFEELSPVPR